MAYSLFRVIHAGFSIISRITLCCVHGFKRLSALRQAHGIVEVNEEGLEGVGFLSGLQFRV